MHCRKNFLELTPDERNHLADAFNAIHAAGTIEEHAHHHAQYFYNGIHFGAAFLPWHRHMLLMIEQALQSVDPTVMLPYWDWTRADDSQNLDAEPWLSFFGGRGGRGRFATWDFTRDSAPSNSLPTLESVRTILGASSFAEFRAMECSVHAAPHVWVGSTMAGAESPRDPLFYLHHCNVDRLWALWQLNHPSATQYTLDSDGPCDSVDAAMVPLNDPMINGATPASMLEHRALGYFYHDDPRLLPLITGDASDIHLETPHIIFNDVPEGETTKRAALFKIDGCVRLSFEVTGPAAPFSLFAPGPFPYPAASGFPTEAVRIWVLFTGGAPGSVASGVMTVVARNEFGDEVRRWDNIPIFANSVARPRVAVAMVLDESGSMLYDAGNTRTRLQVLQLAATTFVDQLFDDNGISMVSFADASDQLMDLQTAGDLASSVRGEARQQIALHGPANVYAHTCIGAGLQKAAEIYAASPVSPNFDIKSTIVFTDGFEDRSPYISQVRSLLNERVYAIGLGDAAHVQNDTLSALAHDTGGYMLVTGAIQQDDQFLLEKFFIQVLVGVTNRDIVLDPDGTLIPGQVSRIPFSIARSDISFDAVSISRAPRYIAMALQAPDGTVISPAAVAPGQFRVGNTSGGFRVSLPVVMDGREHWEGEWQLLLALAQIRDVPLSVAKFPAAGFGQGVALPFHALMYARSNLHLRARLTQSGVTPGSTLHLRALLTEYGQPLETHPRVVATMTRPDRTTGLVTFVETGLGEFDASVTANQAGAYRFHLQAAGLSGHGDAFTREHLLTAVVGLSSPTPPGEPSEPGEQSHATLCDFLKCLTSHGVLSQRLVRKLDDLGIDLSQLQQCLCHENRPPEDRTVPK